MLNDIKNKRDLIVLVADGQMEATLRSLLHRPEALGIRNITFDIYVHPHHDAGCRLGANSFLQSFRDNYLYSFILFDREGCGEENTLLQDLELKVENSLAESAWVNRTGVAIIDPELETWAWKNSSHLCNALGWENNLEGLYEWLRKENHLKEGETRPKRPKEALEAALREAHKPRSSAIYSQLATSLSLKKCVDPAFLKLQSRLQSWFPRGVN